MNKWEGDKPCGYVAKDGRECTQRKGHWAERGDTRNGSEHGHCKPDYWRDREKCPNRAEHYTEVYAGRISEKHHSTRDGVNTTLLLDGKPFSKTHTNEHCSGCELAMIWTPK